MYGTNNRYYKVLLNDGAALWIKGKEKTDLVCKIKLEQNFIDTNIFDKSRFRLVKNFTKKKHLILYFDYIYLLNYLL